MSDAPDNFDALSEGSGHDNQPAQKKLDPRILALIRELAIAYARADHEAEIGQRSIAPDDGR